MLSTNNYYITSTNNNSNEPIIDRLVGWSSACLDSTIYYYLNYKQADSLKHKQKKSNKTRS